MIDIETLGTDLGSVILEVGLVAFHNRGLVATHQVSLDIEESKAKGFTESAATLKWWFDQGGIPMEVIDTMKPVINCLQEITKFIQYHRNSKPDITRIWTRGNFDLPMLERYYQAYHLRAPWAYYEHRELRTALDVLGAPVKQPYTEHQALGDALSQVTQLQTARQNISQETYEKEYAQVSQKLKDIKEFVSYEMTGNSYFEQQLRGLTK